MSTFEEAVGRALGSAPPSPQNSSSNSFVCASSGASGSTIAEDISPKLLFVASNVDFPTILFAALMIALVARDAKYKADYLDELFPNPKCELNYNKDYEFLIAIVLSAQTTDKRVNKVTEVLFREYPDLDSLYLKSMIL